MRQHAQMSSLPAEVVGGRPLSAASAVIRSATAERARGASPLSRSRIRHDASRRVAAVSSSFALRVAPPRNASRPVFHAHGTSATVARRDATGSRVLIV